MLPRNCFLPRRRSSSHKTVNQKIHNIFNCEKINKSVPPILNDELVYFFSEILLEFFRSELRNVSVEGQIGGRIIIFSLLLIIVIIIFVEQL